jgi:hypothetical protein
VDYIHFPGQSGCYVLPVNRAIRVAEALPLMRETHRR